MKGMFDRSSEMMYFDDAVNESLKEKWGAKHRIYRSIKIPRGWNELVMGMFEELSEVRCKSEIATVGDSWGQLDIEIWLLRRSGRQVRAYEIEEKYRMISSRTCFGCGKDGRRMVVGEHVQVLCKKCHEEMKVVMRGDQITGTWLDQI